MDDYLLLRFGHSPSRRYAEAVELARSIPSYQCNSTAEAIQHEVLFSAERAFEFLDLLLIVKRWKSSGLLAPEGEIAPGRVSRGLKCYWQRENNLKNRDYATGRDYCVGIHSDHCGRGWDSCLRNDLGCRLSGFGCEATGAWAGIMLETAEGVKIDRTRLRLQLEENLRQLRFCPALDLESLLERVMTCPVEEFVRPNYFISFGNRLMAKSADRGVAAYDTAIALFPDSPEAHVAKASCLQSDVEPTETLDRWQLEPKEMLDRWREEMMHHLGQIRVLSELLTQDLKDLVEMESMIAEGRRQPYELENELTALERRTLQRVEAFRGHLEHLTSEKGLRNFDEKAEVPVKRAITKLWKALEHLKKGSEG